MKVLPFKGLVYYTKAGTCCVCAGTGKVIYGPLDLGGGRIDVCPQCKGAGKRKEPNS